MGDRLTGPEVACDVDRLEDASKRPILIDAKGRERRAVARPDAEDGSTVAYLVDRRRLRGEFHRMGLVGLTIPGPSRISSVASAIRESATNGSRLK